MADVPITVTGRPALAWGSKVSAEFEAEVWKISGRLAIQQRAPFDPNWLMGIMAWESGRTFSPKVQNMGGSQAYGLIQFMKPVADDLGTTLAHLISLTAVQQLAYVEAYFALQIKRRGPITTLEDAYMAVLYPVAIGKAVSYVLFDSKAQATAYRQNAGLDSDHDGKVSKWEAAFKVRQTLTEGMKFKA